MGFQIGFDTGGTFTDAVLVDDARCVLATAKALTRHENLLAGLGEALDAVLRESSRGVSDGLSGESAGESSDGPSGGPAGGSADRSKGTASDGAACADVASAVTLVSLSTTLATNALVEGRGRPVGLVLIGLDERRLGRARLADALGGDPCCFLGGGHDAAGTELAPLDETALADFVTRHADEVDAWAVSALFATRNAAHERRARALIASSSDKPVSLGHALSAGLDAPRRALTALLNARLVPLIAELIGAARALLEERSISAPLMVVKGDGSLISAEVAADSPVETILSGPAASLVGARFLCAEPDLIVADTGGTTTDIAELVDGRPRLVSDGATVGGWRTMVRAVDVSTVALGGDGELGVPDGRLHLGARRVRPLALLTQHHPALLGVLEAQLATPRSGSHDGRFALALRPPTRSALARLGTSERELLARVASGPAALSTLFAERSRERALERLERAGLVLIAAFTPSDASHLTGRQCGWERRGAELGARLLMRRAEAQGAPPHASVELFAESACRHVAERIALALADAVLVVEGGAAVPGAESGLTASQRRLLLRGFADVQAAERPGGAAVPLSSLAVHVRLGLPLAGLGAPAASYHAMAARLLGTRALLPLHGDVANALGAVVGHVRQEVCVTLVNGGGKAVRVLLDDGPVLSPDLEQGVALATREASERATALAVAAGVGEVTLGVRREDDIVTRDGARVLLESRVTVVATGRPASG